MLDLLITFADLIVSCKSLPNKKLSIFVFCNCAFMSGLSVESIKLLLVAESVC